MVTLKSDNRHVRDRKQRTLEWQCDDQCLKSMQGKPKYPGGRDRSPRVVGATVEFASQERYERIRASPIIFMAKELEISEVGLGKSCKKHRIP